jgi:hypothetical protein
MMKQTFKAMPLVCLALIFGFHSVAHSYEIDTHEKISNVAAQQFIDLKHYDFTNLGLVSLDDNLTADGLKCRPTKTATQTAMEWIKEGSVCEDDTVTETFFRYKNHFYDPVHKKGLGGIFWPNSGIMSGERAPDWAIDMGPADKQLYSFSQGRKYYYDAVTKSTDVERKANLARMFRTLGNVMHVVQDMAQPQHTRNDSHALPSSRYETYTDANRAKLTYDGEEIPKYATAQEYFTNLAQFSNNNFVSAGTNFNNLVNGQVVPNSGYALPVPGVATEVPVHTLTPAVSADILAKCGASTPCVMTFYSTKQTVENKRATTVSIFDQYIKKPVTYTDSVTSTGYQSDRVFMLNSYTFDSAHPFLIPRAVAYSTGILDYFFRGSIDMAPDTRNYGKYLIRNRGAEDMSGNFALYYDAVDGNRYPVPNAAWSNTTIAAGGQVNNLSVLWPGNPAPQTPGEFTLVFNGTMGAEQAGNNSLGVPNGSIGAITAKKVKLPCRYPSIRMTNATVNVTTSGWATGARTTLFDGPNHSPLVYSIRYTQTTTISVDGVVVGTINEIADAGSASSNVRSWAITGASASYGIQNNVMTEAQVVGLQSTQYYDGNGILHTSTPVQYQAGAGYYLVNGSTPYFEYGDGSVAWVFLNGLGSYTVVPLPEYAAALSLAATKNQTVVFLSDGTEIASFPYTILDNSGHKANYPITWNGNNWLDLYTDTNDGNGIWSPVFSQRVTFTIPQGVCAPW